ncbi:PH domain-containing protein [Candidatus Saccharibacteria bacterium]|nr:PH domain-containing protein [Candidatus Saccharibacteria bacterium]
MKDELAQVKHARSAKDYPDINLEADEHVVLHLKRSRIGIIGIWSMVAFCAIILSLALILISKNIDFDDTLLTINDASLSYLRIAIFSLYAIILAGGVIGHSIYNANEMFITNHRAIQKSRSSLFANSTNIIELRRIEDVSFRQESLFDHLFQIGILRMATVGEETTYTFRFLDTPHDEVKIISHLVYENKKHSKRDDD